MYYNNNIHTATLNVTRQIGAAMPAVPTELHNTQKYLHAYTQCGLTLPVRTIRNTPAT